MFQLSGEMKLAFFLFMISGLALFLPKVPMVEGSIRFPSFIQNVLRIGQPWATNVPRFVLDTQHEWLKDNSRWLSQYPDVRKAICDNESELWQSGVLPNDLFRNLQIDNNRNGESRLGWKNALDRMREMKNCPAALESVRKLHIDIYVHDSKYSDYTEDSMPPPEVPQIFAEVLPQMTNLEQLHFGVSGKSSAAFEKAFAEANVTLPSVTYLKPGAYSDWLLPRCPNLERVAAGDYFHHWSWRDWEPELPRDKRTPLINAMEGLPVKELRLTAEWSLELLERILETSPNLTSLHMDGPLNVHNNMNLPDGESSLKRYLSILSQFPCLEELYLPPSWELDLGFEGGGGCGNIYFGAGGRAYGRTVARRSAETIERAARLVYNAMPQLKQFAIGYQCPNISLNDAGSVEITWPWTGRMEAYTYEQWPK